MRSTSSKTRFLAPSAIAFALLAAVGLAAAGLIAAACSSDVSSDSTSTSTGVTDTAQTAATASPDTSTPPSDTTPASAGIAPGLPTPSRIVSLSPTATEILFAVGAGSQVVAADEFSNYPPEAPLVPGLSAWAPNLESIAELEPDLVVLSDNSVTEELNNLGIEVLVQAAPVNLQGVYDQILDMGVITGNGSKAQEVVDQMRADVETLVATVSGSPQRTFFHELDDTLYTATSQTLIGYLYSLVGLTNIADNGATDGSGSAYPQLSTEFVLAADPDFIFYADGQCCGQSAESIAARPGWDALSAVRNGNVIEVDEDISSRWGPRSVQFLEAIIAAVVAG